MTAPAAVELVRVYDLCRQLEATIDRLTQRVETLEACVLDLADRDT